MARYDVTWKKNARGIRRYYVNGQRMARHAGKDSSRYIFATKDLILKEGDHCLCDGGEECDASGRLQNMREVVFWQKATAYERRWLVRPLAWADDFTWLLQRRHSFANRRVTAYEQARVESFTEKRGINDVWVIRGRAINFGIDRVTGRILIYDYGCSEVEIDPLMEAA